MPRGSGRASSASVPPPSGRRERRARRPARRAGSPGPVLVMASSGPGRPVRCGVTAWSMVVELNSRVPAQGDGEHQRRAGRREAPRGGAQVRGRQEATDRREHVRAAGRASPAATRATIGPRKPTAANEEERRQLRGRRGRVGRAGGRPRRRTAAPRRRARSVSPPTRPGPKQPRLDGGLRPARGWAAPRAARRPAARTASSAAMTPPPIAAAIGSQAEGDGEVRRGDSRGAPARRRASELSRRPPGPDSRRRADEADDRRLPRDHAADLTGRRGHRSQERDLALALLDREPQRAGHDEDRDEQRHAAERRGDGDQRRAGRLQTSGNSPRPRASAVSTTAPWA